MSEFFVRKMKGTAVPGLVIVGGKFTTTTSGTIDTATAVTYGCSVAKTGSETGRYTITLPRAVPKFLFGSATIVGPDDTALTTTKGLVPAFRNDDIASDGTIELQFVETVTANADTEVQDGASVLFFLVLVDTSVA